MALDLDRLFRNETQNEHVIQNNFDKIEARAQATDEKIRQLEKSLASLVEQLEKMRKAVAGLRSTTAEKTPE